MAKNEPPKLTKVVQNARREGYTKMDYDGAKAYLENLKNQGDAPNYGTKTINQLKTETPGGDDTSWKIKKPKNTNKGDAPNYGTMNNKKDGGGTNYFSMNYMDNKNNAQDANTPSVFKDPDGVAMAGGTYGLNSGHEDITPAQHGEHTEEKDGHSHGGFINKAKNYLRNSAANLEVRYGSSGQQGGLSTRRPDHGFRIFGPKDSEIKNKG